MLFPWEGRLGIDLTALMLLRFMTSLIGSAPRSNLVEECLTGLSESSDGCAGTGPAAACARMAHPN
jgi:hypothetical protein